MNKFKMILSKIKKVSPKNKILTLVALLLIAAPTTFAAWGPSREIFDWNTPEGKQGSLNGPVFNSMINTPAYGDERNITTVKSTAPGSQWTDEVKVKDGEEYQIRAYIHNNANTNTNESGLGVALNTKLRMSIPENQYGTSIEPRSYISASNIRPGGPTTVFDGTFLKSADGKKFKLDYQEGSATIYNSNGQIMIPSTLPDQLLSSSGTAIGSTPGSAQDGKWLGCSEHTGWVIVKVKVVGEPKEEKPAVQIEKNVSTEKIGVNQEFKYTLDVKNTGNVDLNNVKVDDPAPANISFVKAEPTEGVNFTFNSSRVQATIAKLKVGETKRLTIVAKVTKFVPNQIINTACVDAPEVPGEKDDCDDAPITPVEFCPIPGKETLPVGSPECKIPQTTPSTGSGTIITLVSTLSITGATYALARKFAKN